MLTKLDRFGRVIIPKRLREELGINPETKLNISEEGQKIVIELVKDKSPAVNRNGILVFTGKLDSKEKDLIKSDRNKRMRKLLTNRD
ncbi:MAG: AbrB/MazE/SpoVT family DNA-binding domain-containing protein [Melioribacteraceae bacterium]|nr:AbrB/MazE/SpoVT family DNA-binding domain-containing protein [Melioribacteraceae bacterium]